MLDKAQLLEMFRHLHDKTEDEQILEKVLIIDGMNTFLRSVAVNLTINENGDHVGGLIGFLLSIGYAIKSFSPTKVVIVFDGVGGSQHRRRIFSDYKGNRKNKTRISKLDLFKDPKDEEEAIKFQLKRLLRYFDFLPLYFLFVDNIEADDAIAYLVKSIYTDPKYKKIIMSTDKDFYQLIDDSTSVWSPTKKVNYNKAELKTEFGLTASNFLLYKTLIGDSSDNIPGVNRVGLKTLQKRTPILFEEKDITIEEFLKFVEDKKSKEKISFFENILKEKDKIYLNYELIQLQDVKISATTKEKIRNIVTEPLPELNKFELLKLILEDGLNAQIKNPDLWIREVWWKLDSHK